MKYDIPVKTLSGAASSLEEYRGKALLIVNVASRCGMTPQYAGLEALYRKYQGSGLVVLGFPCNQFGAQEPGSAEDIAEFCSTTYDVTFPMFAKIDVKGEAQHPLYQELASVADATGTAGDVKWNFEKFLVDKQGHVKRFRSKVAPEDSEFTQAVVQALAV
jgi:glutathione peroxidase